LGLLVGGALVVAGLAVGIFPQARGGFIMAIFGLGMGGYLVWDSIRQRGARRSGWAAGLVLAAAVGLAAIGYWSTKAVVRTGLADLHGRPVDQGVAAVVLAQSVGRRALAPRAAWLLYPAARVVAVERRTGHCAYPHGGPPSVDYVVTVRVYTWFAIPVTTFEVMCGGAFLRPVQPWL
jgi:hypothetical protein